MVTTAQTHKLDCRIDTDALARAGVDAAMGVSWEPEHGYVWTGKTLRGSHFRLGG
jgi:hypothetical protein